MVRGERPLNPNVVLSNVSPLDFDAASVFACIPFVIIISTFDGYCLVVIGDNFLWYFIGNFIGRAALYMHHTGEKESVTITLKFSLPMK